MKLKTVLPALLAFSSWPSVADEFGAYSFDARFPAALTHISSFGDVAAKGGAGAASPWGSSPNPASLSWSFQENFDRALSAQYSALLFDAGQQIDFFSQSAVFDLRKAGVLRLSFVRGEANKERILNFPVAFDLDLAGGRFDWACKLADDLRLGMGGSYSQAEIIFDAGVFEAFHIDREFWSLRSGLLWEPSDRWLLGFMAEYGQGRNHTTSILPGPGGLVRTVSHQSVPQMLLRPGVAWLIDVEGLSWLHLDYELSRFEAPGKTLKNHRFLLGLEHRVHQMLHVRAGALVDARRNFGWTTGLGIHLCKGFNVDLAYQYGIFPELVGYFGHSQTLSASISFQW